MAFQKFRMRKESDWGRRKSEKNLALWRKKQRRMKAARRA